MRHIAQEPEDPELTLMPNINDAFQSSKSKKYHHTGKWESDKFGSKKQKGCWSCCMNADETNEGCVAVIVDK